MIMSKIILEFLFFVVLSQGFDTNDLVINSTVDVQWTSLTFTIPVHEAKSCSNFSYYYCLDAVEAINSNRVPVMTPFAGLLHTTALAYHNYWLWHSADAEVMNVYSALVAEKHNHFIDQTFYYFIHGYHHMFITPKEYLHLLTDYSENGKELNLIHAYYYPDCHVNIISKLGFGSGTLRRKNHLSEERKQHRGIPYQLKIGASWSEKIPYQNPETFLTFKWFKTIVMCKEQPWICLTT